MHETASWALYLSQTSVDQLWCQSNSRARVLLPLLVVSTWSPHHLNSHLLHVAATARESVEGMSAWRPGQWGYPDHIDRAPDCSHQSVAWEAVTRHENQWFSEGLAECLLAHDLLSICHPYVIHICHPHFIHVDLDICVNVSLISAVCKILGTLFWCLRLERWSTLIYLSRVKHHCRGAQRTVDDLPCHELPLRPSWKQKYIPKEFWTPKKSLHHKNCNLFSPSWHFFSPVI